MDKNHIIIHNFSILMFREFLLKVFAFAGQIILARILSPQDFGFYAIVIFILNLFMLFSDIGLSSAIIQKQKTLYPKELSSIFFTKIALNFLLTVVLFFTAGFTPIFFHSLSANNVLMIKVLSVILLISAYRSISIALLEKDLNYRSIALIDTVGVFIYYIFAIALAFMGFSVWSLIFATILKEIFETVLATLYKPVLPNFSTNLHRVKDLFHFGVFIQGSGIFTFINDSIIPVVGGITLPAFSVGLLSWGSNILSIPQSITDNYGRVAFASFSKIQNDKRLLTEIINKSIQILSFIIILIMVILFACGKEATVYFYSEKWLPGIPALYWLTGGIFFYAITAPVGQGLFALKKSKSVFFSTLFTTLIGFPLAFILTNILGFSGIAVAITLSEGLLCFLYIQAARQVDIKPALLPILFPRIIIGAILLSVLVILNILFHETFFLFITKVILGILIYVSVTVIFISQDRQLFLDLKKQFHL